MAENAKDNESKWEDILSKAGMPKNPKDEGHIPLAKIAKIGRKNRPNGYNPETDIFAEGGPLHDEDTEQCDARIGLEEIKKNPNLLKKLFDRKKRE